MSENFDVLRTWAGIETNPQRTHDKASTTPELRQVAPHSSTFLDLPCFLRDARAPTYLDSVLVSSFQVLEPFCIGTAWG